MDILSITIMMILNEKLHSLGMITEDQKEKIGKEIRNLLN